MRQMNLVGLTLVVLLTAMANVIGAESNLIEREILQIEEQRYQAMMEGDFTLLDAILSDDLIFTHANGTVESKRKFLGALQSGDLKYVSIRTEDVNVRAYGSSCILTGI